MFRSPNCKRRIRRHEFDEPASRPARTDTDRIGTGDIAYRPVFAAKQAGCHIRFVDIGDTWLYRRHLHFSTGKNIAYSFGGAFISDAVSILLKLCTYIAMLFTLVYARRYINERNLTSGHLGGEFYSLSLFAMLGMMVVISAADFFDLMYLGIELMSFPLYALMGFETKRQQGRRGSNQVFHSGRAGFQAFCSTGFPCFTGRQARSDFIEVARISAYSGISRTILVFGIVFVVAGIAFKLGAVPFHMWVPDVFEGAPTAVTLLIAGAPKLAGFAICLRILVEALLPLAFDWQQMLMIIAILSMALGNVAAIMQKNIKQHARLFDDCPDGVHAAGHAGRSQGRDSRHRFHFRVQFGHVLHHSLRAGDARCVRRDPDDVRQGTGSGQTGRFSWPEPSQSMVCPDYARLHVFFCRCSAAGRLFRQIRRVSGTGRCRTDLAGNRRDCLCRNRRVLLSSGRQVHVF